MGDRIASVREIYEAFGAGDGARLAEVLADTRWVEAEGMPYGGTYRGFDEVVANVFGPIGRDVAGFTAIPDEILPVGDDRVLALGRYRGTGASGPLDTPFAHLWTLDNGRVTNFVQYVDTHLFRQAVGA
jgi:ketosteroid isomerase-like protein